jgi:uncharacterized phage protein (TIGR02220 family)
MSLYRKFHTSYWRDVTDEDFTTDERLLYAYLLSNESTKFCGIYRVAKKTILFETGMSENAVDKTMASLAKRNKIFFDAETNEIFIKNWHKYYVPKSPTLQTRVASELASVKSEKLKTIRESILQGNGYKPMEFAPMATATNVELALNSEKIPYREILTYLNDTTGKNFPDVEQYRKKIRAHWRNGMRLEDFKTVIDHKWREWKGEEKSRNWVRPETLFGDKMPTYLAEAPKNRRKPKRTELPCGVCGKAHTLANTWVCIQCGFDVRETDPEKILEYKTQMIDAGFGERLGIK